MKKLLALLLTLAGAGLAQISTLSLPHTIDSAAIPKVSYVDDNDVALKNKVNELVAAQNGDSLKTLVQSNTGLRLTVDADANATGLCVAITHNGATDTIAKFCDDLASRFYGALTGTNLTLSGKLSASDSVVGAHLKTVSGNLIVGGTAAITGAASTGALSATTGSFSSTLGVTGLLTGSAGATLTGGPLIVGADATTQNIRINGPAASDRQIRFTTAGSNRWLINANNTAETGSSAGSDFALNARDDAGNSIDNPLTIARVAGGTITLARPVTVTGAATMAGITSSADISLTKSAASNASVLSATQSDNTSGTSHARLHLTTGGGSGGDPFTRYTVTGVTDWSTGPDNSDGDAYVITPSTTPGGATNGLRISTAGAVTIPGTLGVTGTATFSGTIASGLTASRTVVTDGSGNFAVSTETGTGSHVRATSPTLVTPVLGVATATTIALGGNEAFDYNEGTFTCTLTGFTTTVNGTCRYTRVGKAVILFIPAMTGTSNATTMDLTGIPSEIRPARTKLVPGAQAQDNTTNFYPVAFYYDTGAAGQFAVDVKTTIGGTYNFNGWTSSGTKGIDIGQDIKYDLN